MATVIKLVSNDAHLAQLLRETGMQCVAIGRDVLMALAQPGARQPEVLVLDLRGQNQLPPALVALKRQHPSTGVLLVVSQLDPALMLEAMRAGVNECVTDPVTAPELISAVKRLIGAMSAGSRGEVFAFVGAKGGVGATTAAVNVATALAKNVDGTLLVDLNVAFGDAAVFLGEEPRFSVMDALEHVQRLDEAFFRSLVVRTKSGLELLAAPGRPGSAIVVDATRIRALLDFVSLTHRATVLDVPRSDTAALESLEMATRIILIANQELATVRNASRMADTLRKRYGADRISLVITRTDRRAEIGLEDIQRTVGMTVKHTFPSDYRLALQAMNKGRPIVLDSGSELAAAFAGFARELAGAPEAEQAGKAWSGSLFGRLSPKRA